MVRYKDSGAGTVSLLQKSGGESRFDYITMSQWLTVDFFKAFKNGHMPMGSARIEQAGGYFMVDEKGEAGDPKKGEKRLYLGFQVDLTADMMGPLMERVAKWRIFKGVARNSYYKFIWEGVVEEKPEEIEGLDIRDRGMYQVAGAY